MKKTFLAGLILAIILFLGFNFAAISHDDEEHESHHLMERLKHQTAQVTYDDPAMKTLDTSAFLKVHAVLEGVDDFLVERRAGKITSFPCSNCHNQPLDALLTGLDPEQQNAHWNIRLAHAKGSIMSCTTCHSTKNMDQLVTLTGELVSIDESFKLCAQCHSTQYNDWQGGAHGKAISGWKEGRKAMTCVSCHNPHKPALPKRYPARYNTQMLED